MRVALATNFVSPYRVPLFVALAETPGWKLRVLCSCEKEFDRRWNVKQSLPFSYKVSFNMSYKRTVIHTGKSNYNDVRQVHLPLGLWLDLCEYSPDIVISSEMGVRSLIAATYCFLSRKPLVLWFYGTIHSERDISWKQRLLRNILCRTADTFIGMGSEARRYLESLGVRPEAIFDTKNAIELAHWKSLILLNQQIATRRQLGVSGLCYLYVGRLIPRKGLNLLLDAWEVFCKQDDVDATLILVGDGEQKEGLINRAANMRLKNVKFVPFVQPEKLPEIYQAADIFVFPTLEDVWGLVVNEAMASGLSVICSKYAGCAADLIVERRNGWVVDPLDRTDLIEKLRKAWEARNQKEEMGKAAQEVFASINITGMANGVREAVEYALSS